jgi:hypothetical protein
MAPKRFISIATSERSELLYEQIKAKSRIKKVNAKLRSLKQSGLYDESVAVENIMNYLGTDVVGVKTTKSGYLSTRGIQSKSMTKLAGINKAINEFEKNKTSTVSGMYDLFEERRDELKRFIDDEEFVKNLSYKDIRTIYSVFKSNEYERNSRSFDSKTFFTLYTQAISDKMDKTKFLKEAEHYIEIGSDEDLRNDLINIYDEYISNYSNRK